MRECPRKLAVTAVTYSLAKSISNWPSDMYIAHETKVFDLTLRINATLIYQVARSHTLKSGQDLADVTVNSVLTNWVPTLFRSIHPCPLGASVAHKTKAIAFDNTNQCHPYPPGCEIALESSWDLIAVIEATVLAADWVQAQLICIHPCQSGMYIAHKD